MFDHRYVYAADASKFIDALDDGTVDLFLIDPPYYGIVDDSWDNQWKSEGEYVQWLTSLVRSASTKLKDNGSFLVFGGIGKHGTHPFFKLISEFENFLQFRNMITWKKRRAYGKSHDYLFCREEIVWFSKSTDRTGVTFNVPYLDVKRGYAGFNDKYPAKSEYKRVSNVWDDIPELMRPERNCQKPVALIERLITTHTNPDDLVVDFFAGWGTTGVAALKNDRKFLGCEAIETDAVAANERCVLAYSGSK